MNFRYYFGLLTAVLCVFSITIGAAAAGKANAKDKNPSADEYSKSLATYPYSYVKNPDEKVTPVVQAGGLTINETNKEYLLDENGKGGRTPSQESNANSMSKEFGKIVEKFYDIKSGEELEGFLEKYEANFYKETSQADERFFLALILPLRAFRGIVWRMKPLVEDVGITHSMLLTMVKNSIVNAKLFFPSNSETAFEEYLTLPFVPDGTAPWNKDQSKQVVLPFNKIAKGGEGQYQSHYMNVVIPALERAVERLQSFSIDPKKVYAFDNSIFSGRGTYPDKANRFVGFGEVERQVALYSLYAALAELKFNVAYSWNGSLYLNQDIGRLYGWDAAFKSVDEVDGVPASKRNSAIRNKNYSNWGTLVRTADGNDKLGKDLMVGSFKALEFALVYAESATKLMETRPVREFLLVNTSGAGAFSRWSTERIWNAKRLLSGRVSVASLVTGEPIEVNLKAFYENPPKDLKDLYPTAPFSEAKKSKMDVKNKDGVVIQKDVPIRDFLVGSGKNWKINEDTYKVIFPSLSQNGEDLKKHIRILNQAWAGTGIALAISSYVQ